MDAGLVYVCLRRRGGAVYVCMCVMCVMCEGVQRVSGVYGGRV